MNQAATRGTNDFEIPRLMELMLEVEEGKIDPQVALDEARGIVGNKQDYR
jgi:hypothetical protein